MSGKVTLRVSASAAAVLRGGKNEKMAVVVDGGDLPPFDRVICLISLLQDPEPEVAQGALEALRQLPEPDVIAILAKDDLHPRILALLARFHAGNSAVAAMIAAHRGADEAVQALVAAATPALSGDEGAAEGDSEEEAEPEESFDEEGEEFHSKYQLAQMMGVAEKIKMAMTGDKEWRTILIKDANKLVSTAVIKNGRITEAEVITILKSSVQNDEIIRIICHNKEWLKNYQIRKALVENHKTPLPTSLRLVGTLSDKDIAALAKSKNISTVISTQARKIILAKSKR